jgi:dTDP-4-dehydrorhamnose reductase
MTADRCNRELLLITGVDELVGANLAVCLADRFDVVALPRRRFASPAGCRTVACRFDRPADIAAVVRRHMPQWIIHCGPWSSSSWDPPAAPIDASAEAALCVALADAAQDVNARLTVLSTDAVFAGPWIFHDEQASPASDDPRSSAARCVESALRDTDALVVRTHAYGWSPPGAEPSWVEVLWHRLAEGGPLPLDPEPHATPILVSDLAELLDEAYRRRLTGLYHIAGSERVSMSRFAGQLALAFRLPPVPKAQLASDPRPILPETSLDTRRARADLSCPMPMLAPGLDRFARQLQTGYRAKLR